MKKIPITLYGEQLTIFNDWANTDKHCIDIIHAGAGKTFLASLFLPIAASNHKYHRGKDVLYVAPTREMIKTLIWESLKQSCKDYFGLNDDAINNGDLTIKFPNGVFIRCKSAEQREALRGMNAGIIIMDEASLFNQESLLELTNRLRPKVGQPDTAGRMIVISTPYGAGPLFELYQNAMANPNKFIVRHYNYEQMRSGNLEFIMEQKKILSPMKFAQDYLCSFDSVTDQFFYTFQPQFHTAQIEDIGRGDLYHFADFNKRVATSVIARVNKPYDKTGTIEVLKAYAIDNCGTEQMAKAIRYDFPKRRIFSIIDMSGTQVNRDTTSPFGVTDRTILEKYGFQIINTKNQNPLISDTDNICNAFINQGRLTINATQTKIIEALKTYHFEDGSRKKLVKYNDKYAYIDGLGDCMRYGISLLFPITHDDMGIAEYITSDPRVKRMNTPGLEHMPASPLFPGGPTMEEILNGDDPNDSYAKWM
jgi:hypothetical protein